MCLPWLALNSHIFDNETYIVLRLEEVMYFEEELFRYSLACLSSVYLMVYFKYFLNYIVKSFSVNIELF